MTDDRRSGARARAEVRRPRRPCRARCVRCARKACRAGELERRPSRASPCAHLTVAAMRFAEVDAGVPPGCRPSGPVPTSEPTDRERHGLSLVAVGLDVHDLASTCGSAREGHRAAWQRQRVGHCTQGRGRRPSSLGGFCDPHQQGPVTLATDTRSRRAGLDVDLEPHQVILMPVVPGFAGPDRAAGQWTATCRGPFAKVLLQL